MVNGVGLAFIPILKTLPLLGSVILITGMTSVWLDSGISSLMLTTWGPIESRPYIASFHLSFTFGSFLGPFLVGAFKSKEANKVCDNRPMLRSFVKHESAFEDWSFFDDLDTVGIEIIIKQ